MKQTPLHSTYNEDVLKYIPEDAKRIVEIGCSNGMLAQAYLEKNPSCEYIGIDIEGEYAQRAQAVCTRALVGNIEALTDEELKLLGPVDCWVMADVLEHLYDPWAVLEKLHRVSNPGSSIVICVPNAAHWSIQARLLTGRFHYTDLGLMDRTHIRWFTERTIGEALFDAGWKPIDGMARVFSEEGGKEEYLRWLKMFAECLNQDAQYVLDCASAYQYVIFSTYKEI